MKFTLNILEKRSDNAERRWPGYIFGGRVRTSTLVLIVAFLAVWWVYDTYRPEPAPKPPAPQVVPPGFVPDPNFTWVPRTRVHEPSSTVTTTAPPPFVLPTPPCVLPPPFCPPSASPTPTPSPGPVPAPTSAPPAG